MKITFLLFAITLIFIAKPALASGDSSFVTISFINKIGSEQLQLGKQYINPFGEAFSVSRFKYYISGLTFLSTDGTIVRIPSYYLINEEDSTSKSFTVPLKAGSYKSVSFLVGVDSIKNVSGTQTDALDPMNGMFWTWNSGYIMAKLEGTSSLSKAPGNLVEYHIGGFRASQNTVRNITLPLASTNVFIQRENEGTRLILEADINKWFSGVHDLKIAAYSACTTPGELAVKYADNYSKMFSIVTGDILDK